MGIFTVYCTICATRVNALFFLSFLFLALTFLLEAAAYLYEGDSVGKTVLAHNLQIVSLDRTLPPHYDFDADSLIRRPVEPRVWLPWSSAGIFSWQ